MVQQGNFAAQPLTPEEFSEKLARERDMFGELAEAINLGSS